LVLAGGEGSRLATGSGPSKPMVEVAGAPQIVRQVRLLSGLGVGSVTCMVRDTFPEAGTAVMAETWLVPVSVHLNHTPSSLHTLAEGLERVPAGPVFAAMVDTVMGPDDWRRSFGACAAALEQGAAAALVVTPFVDDEKALYVSVGGREGGRAGGRIDAIGDAPYDPLLVTGGVYAFAASVRPLAAQAVAEGMHKMRAFLGRLVERGLEVRSVTVGKIIDLDRPADLALANAWLGGQKDMQ
jgi:NDP-sugar pyrophosphorylase family protein